MSLQTDAVLKISAGFISSWAWMRQLNVDVIRLTGGVEAGDVQ